MKRELKISGLSYSQSQIGAYVAILDEVRGHRKLPVIIRPGEAQVIAKKLEEVKSKRPSTHEVFRNLTELFQLDVQEVVIHNIAEGIFYTKLVCSDGIDTHEVECTPGDGIAFSLVYGCTLWCEESVLATSGIEVDPAGQLIPLPSSSDGVIDAEPTLADLEKEMQEALSIEDYEEAARLRDKIKTFNDGEPS